MDFDVKIHMLLNRGAILPWMFLKGLKVQFSFQLNFKIKPEGKNEFFKNEIKKRMLNFMKHI